MSAGNLKRPTRTVARNAITARLSTTRPKNPLRSPATDHRRSAWALLTGPEETRFRRQCKGRLRRFRGSSRVALYRRAVHPVLVRDHVPVDVVAAVADLPEGEQRDVVRPRRAVRAEDEVPFRRADDRGGEGRVVAHDDGR